MDKFYLVLGGFCFVKGNNIESFKLVCEYLFFIWLFLYIGYNCFIINYIYIF